jgi:hypothetical protein
MVVVGYAPPLLMASMPRFVVMEADIHVYVVSRWLPGIGVVPQVLHACIGEITVL